MNITGLRNVVLTPDFENVIKTYEALGFERAHEKNDMGTRGNDEVVLKSASGETIIVIGLKETPNTFTALGINVDNIDEASNELEAQGFTRISGQNQKTDSSLGALFRAPQGYMVILSQHTK